MYRFSFTDIEEILSATCRFEGNRSLVYDGFRPVMECTKNHISWIRPKVKKAASYINDTQAGCIICDEATFELFTGNPAETLFIITPNPLLAFVKILHKAEEQVSHADEPLIHPTAIIYTGSKLGHGVKVGAYSIIEECTIGDNTIIDEHVKVHRGAIIGQNCHIREFCSIGGAGFGIAKDEEGNNIHVPHVGKAVIGDNVLMLPFCNVDKGMLGDTIVEDNVVMDHHCHISHNSFVGRNTTITAGVIMSGGSRIGSNCFIGVQTSLKEKAEVGSNVTTGIGTIVTSNIPDNTTYVGNPATELSVFLAQRAFVKKGSAI